MRVSFTDSPTGRFIANLCKKTIKKIADALWFVEGKLRAFNARHKY